MERFTVVIFGISLHRNVNFGEKTLNSECGIGVEQTSKVGLGSKKSEFLQF